MAEEEEEEVQEFWGHGDPSAPRTWDDLCGRLLIHGLHLIEALMQSKPKPGTPEHRLLYDLMASNGRYMSETAEASRRLRENLSTSHSGKA